MTREAELNVAETLGRIEAHLYILGRKYPGDTSLLKLEAYCQDLVAELGMEKTAPLHCTRCGNVCCRCEIPHDYNDCGVPSRA